MKKLLFILIIVLAFGLRFWRLDSYPAFNADEAAIGYNAYSLIKTGMDEHGNSWPIHFQSFNDYKPGLYFYTVIPFVKLLGLNEWAVRIPGAFAGVLTVLVLYYLTLEIFKKYLNIKENENLALITSGMLAISPWHIHFSRGGWEVNLATFFIVLGTWLFIKFINTREKAYYLILSFFSFILSLYTYHAARIVVPLLGLGLLVIYFRDLFVKKNLKVIIISLSVSFLLLIPLILDFTKGAVSSRVTGVGLFADPGPLSRIEEQRTEHGDFRSLPAKLIHNKVVNYGLAFMDNWGEHFHGLFLFLSGDDIQRNKVPETGEMYLTDILFLAVGIIVLIKRFKEKPIKLIFYWLIIAPMAAALTFQSPHALRAQNMVIPLTIISSLGLLTIIGLITKNKNKIIRILLLVLISVATILGFLRYEHMYWVHMAKEYPYSSQYGLKELVTYVNENKDKYKNIVVTDRYDQPYILFLFYTKYDPLTFQKNHTLTARDGYGFSTVKNFDKYHFLSIKYDEMRPIYPNSLLVGTPEEISNEANIVKEIYGSNSFKYFRIVAN
ncbi:hypothetical protein A2422_02525 [Candidatus Woesebacteria bacterium RIFOXYC1_FULL_31_51]|uniref:ArnT-like N-terminal domain-containing protein n=1 Tax=Candidatus Woesebacteria bacterium GW2011_GWC2_31_9 TaxID=1618586 RepID=A0A0F9YXC8_9BACT|nr:MAG: hypothetical protein UR17_C0001G0009 [Candidatus Woesebacteria bacterium GW2011_GWF1_31_35]KKP23493.1 MAG: hypothetical protein UR11_C0001G0467 [Candidatus Woesebacteria bacterium GW2011_GWC1_30_29]KKP26470.1 MAG: hypothetical protein UR13_C0004G0084 [Candidatus Woesebacteria bacterium GW2011_GWD1_31_12]KKP27769.1 MAG: hypothetical protein UR16_C0002G0099 [Candidatus Woesebacteria bacterium GW2011_GWB1_31_29]KKP31091.1 MAG: hypothetical protein UR21_C0016G0009 [Candidatus Woesebacteria 